MKDYIPYGPEWVSAMMRMRKTDIIELFVKAREEIVLLASRHDEDRALWAEERGRLVGERDGAQEAVRMMQDRLQRILDARIENSLSSGATTSTPQSTASAELEELRQGLIDAVGSLDTLSRTGGHGSGLKSLADVRGFANSRWYVANKILSRKPEQGKS
jgi:hypothetical protein